MVWLWFILWIATIFAGAFGAEFAPDNFTYIIGFAAGTFSFMFLRLFGDWCKKKRGEDV